MSAHRKVYAKGFYDGLKAAGNEGHEMTPTKYKLAVESQTAIARKIFENTPIKDAWTANKIVGEMARMGMTRVDVRTAEGCLDGLKECGLVKEPERGLYQRVTPRTPATVPTIEPAPIEAPAAAPAAPVPVVEPAKAEPVDQAPTSILGVIAAGLRQRAAELLAAADEIDDAALGFEERMEQADARSDKFRQLAALLKEI